MMMNEQTNEIKREDRDYLFLVLLRSELGNLRLKKKESVDNGFSVDNLLNVRIVLLQQLIEIYEQEVNGEE